MDKPCRSLPLPSTIGQIYVMEAFLMAQGDPPDKSAGMGIVLSLGLLWWRDDSIFGLAEERRDTHFLFGY